MTAKTIPAPVIVIFGITGDLSKRKLLPALYHLFSHGLLAEDTKIIGTSRQPLSAKELLDSVELCVLEKDKVCDPVGLARVSAALQTFQLDPENADDYASLKAVLDKIDGPGQRDRLLYMSIPAGAYAPIVSHLAAAKLNDSHSRLLLEKPFGYDAASAKALVKLVDKDFDESQVYRIDHYLAKETAQNLLAFRLHNPMFAPLWNSGHIKRVHIIAAEAIGVEGRANFYEQTGALRDLIQSHLMQLLGIALMDLPSDMSSTAIHQSKQQFFKQLLPADPADAIRGQYDSYRQEVGNPASNVETYALLKLKSGDKNWQGTEIILETGKALDRKATEIKIEFRTPDAGEQNSLTFHIQPNEGITLDLATNQPGYADHVRQAAMDFEYHDTYGERLHIDAYERVLLDAIGGDQSLFASDRDVIESWRVLQPVLEAWQKSGASLVTYPSGSAGPHNNK